MASCSTTGRASITPACSSRQRNARAVTLQGSSSPVGSIAVLGRPSQGVCNSRASSLSIQAKAGDGKSGDFDINPFGKKKEEDAAKKALQEMFSGKDDLLAAYDGPPGGGNSGGGGGGGGGGFNFNEFGDNFKRSMKGWLSFVGAVILLGLLCYVLRYWQLVFAVLGMLLTKIFRLDAGQRKIENAGAGNLEASLNDDKSDFGVMEQSVISKYGGDDAKDDTPAAAEGGEDEDEEDF